MGIIEAYLDAAEAYRDYMVFEAFPRAGGYRDQETWWLEAIACVKAAKRDADREKEAREAGNMQEAPTAQAPGQEWQMGTDRISAAQLGTY